MRSMHDSIGERALAPNDPPYFKVYVNIGDLGVVRALRSAVLALDVRKLDGLQAIRGPVACTYPHVEISSKFEVLGPRNGQRPWPDLVKTPQS